MIMLLPGWTDEALDHQEHDTRTLTINIVNRNGTLDYYGSRVSFIMTGSDYRARSCTKQYMGGGEGGGAPMGAFHEEENAILKCAVDMVYMSELFSRFLLFLMAVSRCCLCTLRQAT